MHKTLERRFSSDQDAARSTYPTFDERGSTCLLRRLLLALPLGSKERVLKGPFGQVLVPLLRFQAKDIVFDELHMLLRIMDR